jgi:hypothetical protein
LDFDLVVSLGNPQTCHLAAFLATRRRCSWVPFYGDAWGLDPGLAARPAWTRAVNRMLERWVLKGAARVVVCTEEMKAALCAAYGIKAARISSIRLSTADLDAYEAITPAPSANFHLVYTGTIYKALQDPLPLLRAASRLDSRSIKISFIGTIAPEYVRAAGACGLHADFPGWREPSEIIAAQKSATVLLVFGHRGAQVMPSKVYEYLAARRPIMAVCADERDPLAPIIKQHRRGVIAANCEDEIERVLRRLIDLHAANQLDAAFDLSLLPQYSAAATARSLMEGILSAAIPPPPSMAAGPAAQEI